MRLHRVTGPECPSCGCEDSQLVRTGTRWGDPVEYRRCAHCGFGWQTTAATVEQIEAPDPDSPEAEAYRAFRHRR